MAAVEEGSPRHLAAVTGAPPVRVAIVDYGMGNLRSVGKAFEYLGAEVVLVESADAVESSFEALILPGVGALRDCVAGLRERGLDRTVREWIGKDRPFFGICLGLQVLFEHSEEDDAEGLGIFPGRVIRFHSAPGLRIPHMGWTPVCFEKSEPDLLQDIRVDGDAFYFVHSYHAVPSEPGLVWATAWHGAPFTAAIRRGECVATQFHPEKSQSKGLQLYRNFLTHVASRRP
jgi:glutamine amidotransferase